MKSNPLAPSWLAMPEDANVLAASVWSQNSVRAASGVIEIAGVSALEIAERFGTPVYVVDETDVRERARAAHDAFSREFARVGSSARVYYAGKAFLSTEIARWVAEAGLNIDVCSGGELAVALAAGVAPGRLGFHGNNKSLAEIDRAVAAGVGVLVIDSIVEIGRIAEAAARYGVVQPVRLRVNSGVHAHTHEYLATAREDQKFGIALSDAADAVAAIRAQPALEFLGLHSHIGSQIFGMDGFVAAASRLLELHAELLRGGPIPELNLGGGFGIAYTSVDVALPLEEIAAGLADIVAGECARLDIPVPVVAVEPGRSIVGPSTSTLYTVGTVKDVEVTFPEPVEGAGASLPTDTAARFFESSGTGGVGPGSATDTATRKYVSIDGGMSDNVRPALYAADYTVRIAGRASTADPVLVRIAGKHCESGDIVVHADYLPGDVQPGDIVAVAATGAYCWSLSSNYNYLGRPPVVAVRDGVARVIVRGETEADLLSRDAGISAGSIIAPEKDKERGITMIEYRNLRVALLGAGSVGAQVASLLLQHGAELATRAGAGLELVGVAVRELDAARSADIPQELLTTDAESLIVGADIVIELMGGIEPARSYILQALNSGADVITGNKALLATHGPELFDAAEQVGAQLYYEAAVAGAIPIIRPLRDSLAGDRILRILGIVNGTTNFILDRMDTAGESLEAALATATELGYAEKSDPSADIEGFDAAQKTALLASLAFHTTVPLDRVYREGITSITLEQVDAARKAGYVVKLLSISERLTDADTGEEGVSARVYPALVPRDHPLAAVHGAKNAVFVEAEAAGDLMFYGAGAGGKETASAVLGDLVSAARRHVIGGPGVAESNHAKLPILPISRITTRYQITLSVIDQPGVLAAVAALFSAHRVSVETLEQSVRTVRQGDGAATATLVIGTHKASESDLSATVAALEASDVVSSVTSVLRVEGF